MPPALKMAACRPPARLAASQRLLAARTTPRPAPSAPRRSLVAAPRAQAHTETLVITSPAELLSSSELATASPLHHPHRATSPPSPRRQHHHAVTPEPEVADLFSLGSLRSFADLRPRLTAALAALRAHPGRAPAAAVAAFARRALTVWLRAAPVVAVNQSYGTAVHKGGHTMHPGAGNAKLAAVRRPGCVAPEPLLLALELLAHGSPAAATTERTSRRILDAMVDADMSGWTIEQHLRALAALQATGLQTAAAASATLARAQRRLARSGRLAPHQALALLAAWADQAEVGAGAPSAAEMSTLLARLELRRLSVAELEEATLAARAFAWPSPAGHAAWRLVQGVAAEAVHREGEAAAERAPKDAAAAHQANLAETRAGCRQLQALAIAAAASMRPALAAQLAGSIRGLEGAAVAALAAAQAPAHRQSREEVALAACVLAAQGGWAD